MTFFFFFFFFFGDTITVTNFSGKNLVPPQIGLRSYAHGLRHPFANIVVACIGVKQKGLEVASLSLVCSQRP